AAHIADKSRPFAGVPDTLAELREAGCRLAVATNKPQDLSERLLAALSLAHLFDAVVGRDAAPRPKPHPSHLYHALELAGGEAPAVMVGDSATDLDAGRAAEIPVILVDYGYTPVPAHMLGADQVISRFDRLVPLVLSR
ncbi:MAG: HAD family hydrolase, partial [Alphaproteobacteria bacterium]